jgi:hypothetical protein
MPLFFMDFFKLGFGREFRTDRFSGAGSNVVV